MDSLFSRPPLTVLEAWSISGPPLSCIYLAYYILPKHKPKTNKIKSGLFASQSPLQNGDILIHSGDMTVSGTQRELDDVLSWLESQSHPHKFFIAGNHDAILAKHPDIHQYNPTPDHQCTQVWSQIPPLTDILITHCPPLGHLDNDTSLNLEKAASGCYALLARLWLVRPKVHVLGHIHVGRGIELVRWDKAQKAYEDILAQRAEWMGLVRLAWHRALMWFRKGSSEDGMLMVNAAAVGGIREDQRLGATVIEI